MTGCPGSCSKPAAALGEVPVGAVVVQGGAIIATGHNNLAMNRGITQAAKQFVKGSKIAEGALNRVEAVIRCYDPCLSCSTHALGAMPLHLQLVSAEGTVLDECRRG
jgi:NAD-reducing hydrogenase large subunit